MIIMTEFTIGEINKRLEIEAKDFPEIAKAALKAVQYEPKKFDAENNMLIAECVDLIEPIYTRNFSYHAQLQWKKVDYAIEINIQVSQEYANKESQHAQSLCILYAENIWSAICKIAEKPKVVIY
jgi:hypothetical protein